MGIQIKILRLDFIFAITTLIGWSYFGEKAFAFLWGDKNIGVYKLLYIDADMVLESEPGKGTKITVTFFEKKDVCEKSF